MADYFEEARQTDTTMTVTTADTTPESTALAAPSTEGLTIMAYPPGVSLATITIGAGRTMFGAPPKLISATVTPIFVGTPHVVHAASGWAFYPTPRTFRVENGEELTFELPHVNAEGWRDTAGNEFPALLESGERDRGWAYHAKFTIIGGSGQDATPHRYEKVFQPLVGQTEPLDLDLVPDGRIGEPVSAPVALVTSVAGLTGIVTEEDLLALGLGVALEDVEAVAAAVGDQAVIDAGTYTDQAVDHTRTDLTPTNGARPVGKGELFLNVKDFGAKGDGVTDDTAAFQAFVNRVVLTPNTGHGSAGYIPEGDYRVSSTIVIPRRPGWSIRGANRDTTRVRQTTDNIPVFDLGGAPGSELHSYELSDFTIGYARSQPATNINATGILITQEAYQGAWRNLTFENGFYANRVPSGVNAPWGHTFDDLWFKDGLTGGAMEWRNSIRGIPNNHFGRLFVNAINMTATIFDMRLYNCSIDTIEIIQASRGPRLFELGDGGKLDVGSMKLENGTFTAGKSLFYFRSSSYVRIGHLTCSGSNLDFSGGTYGLVHTEADTRVDIGYLDLSATTIAEGSSLYALQGANIHVNKLKLGANVTGLSDAGSSATQETITVKDYLNGRLSQDKGDANYTVALGDPNVVAFNTAFTAPRTINLPEKVNFLFNGLSYEFIFDGAINGANTATIKAGAWTLRTQSTDKVNIGFTYRRHGFDLSLSWKLTKYEVLPGGASVLTSANGTRYRIVVDDTGALSTTAL